MNQMTTATGGGAIAALSQLKSGLANVSASLPKAGGDPILRMLKDGNWVYGADDMDIQPGSRWAANILSIEHGFVSWTRYSDRDKNDKRKDELVGERMVSFLQPQPDRSALPNTGWDWTEQVSVLFQCLSGEDEGTVIVYKPTSVGGITAMRKLIDSVMTQLDRDEKHPVPVVLFENDTYQHKRHGKVYVPILNIVQWVALDNPENIGGNIAAPEADLEEEEEQTETVSAAPTRRRPAAEEQTQAAPPTRRRAPVEQQNSTGPDASSADVGVVRRRRSL